MMNPLYLFQQLLGRKSKVLTALGLFLLSTPLNYMYIIPVLFIYTVSERSYGQTTYQATTTSSRDRQRPYRGKWLSAHKG